MEQKYHVGDAMCHSCRGFSFKKKKPTQFHDLILKKKKKMSNSHCKKPPLKPALASELANRLAEMNADSFNGISPARTAQVFPRRRERCQSLFSTNDGGDGVGRQLSVQPQERCMKHFEKELRFRDVNTVPGVYTKSLRVRRLCSE